MALHITNPEVEQKVRRMAFVTGESITDAMGLAAEERTKRAESGSMRPDPSVDEILALVRSFKLEPINEHLSDEEVLGYDPNGSCNSW